MIAPARVAAYEALYAVAGANRDLPDALLHTRLQLADERDRALTAELVIGTLRWQAQLDYLIEALSGRALARIDPEVLQILRLGAYQLVHLTRVPAAAAVNDAVALTRRAGKSSASSFVNAVLRKLSQTKPLPLPDRGAGLDYLATSLSHPRWLASRWLTRYGFQQAEGWEIFNNAPAPLTLRVNTLKTTAGTLTERLQKEGVTVSAARYAPDGLIVTAGNPLRTSLAGSGLFFVQDEASQLVSLLAHPAPGDRILDACASPGGKTTAMAAQGADQGLIVAADVRPARVKLLQDTVRVSGTRSVRVVRADLGRPLPFGPVFDVVLVDAPCSGLGTIRRDPDIRWKRREDDLGRMAAAQVQMLIHASQVVGRGGRLIYATCSSEPEENDEVVAEFLRISPAFAAVNLLQQRDFVHPALSTVLDEAGRLRTLPPVHQLEAFFGAVLRREG